MEIFLKSLSYGQVIYFILVENIFIFFISVFSGEILFRFFKPKLIKDLRAISFKEISLACLCVFNNSIITLGGYLLYKSNFIRFKSPSTVREDIFSFLILFFTMDFAMYVLHRLAHLELIYPFVHKSHHEFVKVDVPRVCLGVGRHFVAKQIGSRGGPGGSPSIAQRGVVRV